nr:hypothetical protein [Bradyrhizobium sp. 76]
MKAPSGAQWIHEVKYDGYRIQLHIDGDTRKAFTRNGHNWVNRFSVIAGAFNIPGQAIVDGEVVVIHGERTNFSELQADIGRGDQDWLVYFAFDLLWLDGKDLRRMSQLARKELLKQLIDENGLEAPIFYSEHHGGDGQALFEAASLTTKASSRSGLMPRTGRSGSRPGRRSRPSNVRNSPSLASSKTRPALPRSTSARRKGKS